MVPHDDETGQRSPRDGRCEYPSCHHAWREVCADCGRHVCWTHTYWLGEGAMRLPFCAQCYADYGRIPG
jgi:hypothetical protein